MAEFRSWRLDFDGLAGSERRNVIEPPGFDAALSKDTTATSSLRSNKKDVNVVRRKQQALMQRATAPFKQVAFMCFMMWMMASGISIFSIMILVGGITSPVFAIVKSGEAFPSDEDSNVDVWTPRLLYCLIHIGQLLFAVHKLNGLGLLPTAASDWLSAMAVPQSLEYSYAAM